MLYYDDNVTSYSPLIIHQLETFVTFDHYHEDNSCFCYIIVVGSSLSTSSAKQGMIHLSYKFLLLIM